MGRPGLRRCVCVCVGGGSGGQERVTWPEIPMSLVRRGPEKERRHRSTSLRGPWAFAMQVSILSQPKHENGRLVRRQVGGGGEVTNGGWRRDVKEGTWKPARLPLFTPPGGSPQHPGDRGTESRRHRPREHDREALTDRHTHAHALTHMHAHRHGRNGRGQGNSEEAERQASVKPPSPASHPAPRPQLTTTRVRLGASISAPSVPGPAGLGGAQTARPPRGLRLQAELLHVQTAGVYLAQRCGKDCPPPLPATYWGSGLGRGEGRG